MSNSLKPLYIVGAGGFGREVAWLAETINKEKNTWDIKGFIDDDSELWDKVIDDYHVLGGLNILEVQSSDIWCVVAVGNAAVRKRITQKLDESEHIKYATLISPDVKMGFGNTIGEGTIICAGTIITVDASIGRHNIINLSCTIGHDAELDDYVTLYPSVNVSGKVRIGNTTEVGTGTQIIQGIDICEEVILGAGAVVVEDIKEPGTYVGVPVRRV